jgi:hypothetical protein
MELREERIVVETTRHRLTGTVQLAASGYRSRLTDHLNAAGQDFLALTDVEIVPLDGARPRERRPFVALGRRHVVFAAPLESDG